MNVVKVSPIAVLGPAAIFPAGCWVEDWRLQPGNIPKTRLRRRFKLKRLAAAGFPATIALGER